MAYRQFEPGVDPKAVLNDGALQAFGRQCASMTRYGDVSVALDFLRAVVYRS